MTRRTDQQLANLFAVLRGAHADPVTGQPATDPDLHSLERRLARALERDRTGGAAADGYRSSSLGGSAGGSENTSVEGAVLRGMYLVDPLDPEGPAYYVPPRDDVHALVVAARRAAETAAANVALLRKKLDALDVLTGTVGAADLDHDDCESCARFSDADGEPFSTPMLKFTDVPDGAGVARLTRKWRLCQWCFDQVRKDRPGEAALPSEDRIRGVHEGRRQRRRAS